MSNRKGNCKNYFRLNTFEISFRYCIWQRYTRIGSSAAKCSKFRFLSTLCRQHCQFSSNVQKLNLRAPKESSNMKIKKYFLCPFKHFIYTQLLQQSASGQGYNTHQTRHEINLYNFEVSIKVFGYRFYQLLVHRKM